MNRQPTIRQFTGWHMATLMVAFFGVVIAVNFIMARAAIRTFGGEVVENSYVASQRYNGWLKDARAQHREGWSAVPAVKAGGIVEITVARAGADVGDAQVTLVVNHPLGRVPARTLALHPAGARGHYRAEQPLAAGRWLLHITITRGREQARFVDEVHA